MCPPMSHCFLLVKIKLFLNDLFLRSSISSFLSCSCVSSLFIRSTSSFLFWSWSCVSIFFIRSVRLFKCLGFQQELILYIQKPVKWFAMQNSWLVSKPFTFLVKGISKKTLTHFPPMFHLRKPLVGFYKQNVWKITYGRVTLSLKMQVVDLFLYLKCHSTTTIF